MFLSDDFLLTNQWSRKLYHSSAEKMPIIDYHCHLSPKEIYENKPFTNLTEAWLSGDHYKWRLMRACGVPEEKITGHASDYEKFYAWCQTVPKIIGNPLYTWTHLELKRFFQIDLLINEENALNIWEQANKRLAEPAFRRREMAKNAKVTVICTTDDPIDELVYHELLAKEEPDLKVLPAFRPDAALNLTHEGFSEWLSKLSHVIGKPIADYTSLITALSQRIDYFHQHGCRLSDHGLDRLSYHTASENELEQIFQKALTKETLTQTEIDAYRTETLNRLITLYHAHGWTMQLHLHAYRNCNTQAFTRLGPDTGYDGINDQPLTSHLQQLLDHADQTSQLPKTILYSLNPNDYPLLLALMGCFQKRKPPENFNSVLVGGITIPEQACVNR